MRGNAKTDPIRVILHRPCLVRHLLQSALRQPLGHSILATGLGELRDEGRHFRVIHSLALPQPLQIIDHQCGLFELPIQTKDTCISQKHCHSRNLLEDIRILLRHPRRHLLQTRLILHNHDLVGLPVSCRGGRLSVIVDANNNKGEGENAV